MTWGFNYRPEDYPPGSELFISIRIGWNNHDVARYIVERHTPKGQVVASRALACGTTDTIRINTRGDVVGDGAYGRRQVTSREDAEQIREEMRRKQAWNEAYTAGEKIIKASRQKDTDALAAAVLELMGICEKIKARAAQAGEAGTAETPLGGSVHEHAVREANAP